jgi:uncharacterized protein (TIGR04222 family)
MNPFALPGPDFLEFIGALSLLVVLAILALRQLLGPGGRPQRRVTDPYAIALLRGGTPEAIRVGAMNLVRRELLLCSGRSLRAAAGALDQVRDEAERGLVMACLSPIEGWRLLGSPSARSGFANRLHELEVQGLAPDAGLRQTFRLLAVAGILVVGFFGLGKLLMALSSGHARVFFLPILLIAVAAVLLWLFARLPTAAPRGRTLLGELQALLGSLRSHAVAGKPEEALFLSAVFGAAALSASDQAVMQGAFRPQPNTSISSSGCSSGSGSGCGSGGSGGSGGGGCGGGGCGGCGGGG